MPKEGFDLFETVPGEASFIFPNNFMVPADFFDTGSQPFAGSIPLEGVPIQKFTDPRNGQTHLTGTADTAVHRKQDVTLSAANPTGKTEIQLLQLNLKSISPIAVHVGRAIQHWDVFVSPSTTAPSVGSMTISNNHTFESSLRPIPNFRFVRRSDGETKTLDVGTLKLPPKQQQNLALAMTLTSTDVQWSPGPPEGDPNVLFITALSEDFCVACPLPAFEIAAFMRHGVRCPKKK